MRIYSKIWRRHETRKAYKPLHGGDTFDFEKRKLLNLFKKYELLHTESKHCFDRIC